MPFVKSLLSLDLGVTTGYAMIVFGFDFSDYPKADTRVLQYGTLQYESYRSQLNNLLAEFHVSYSVAEKPVIVRGPLGDKLQEVINHTSQVLMRQVEFVDPTRWKSTPYKKYPTPKKLTPHERDAIRLGMWYVHELQGRQ